MYVHKCVIMINSANLLRPFAETTGYRLIEYMKKGKTQTGSGGCGFLIRIISPLALQDFFPPYQMETDFCGKFGAFSVRQAFSVIKAKFHLRKISIELFHAPYREISSGFSLNFWP